MSTTRRGLFNAVVAFLRATPLDRTYATSALIGPAGGTLSVPHAGLEIEIPEGALAKDSSVYVTAHPSVVGFSVSMSPLQTLAKRARVSQRLEAHHTSSKPPVLGHVDTIAEQADCRELFQATVTDDVATAFVPHFSGYIFAGGNGSNQPCDPDTDGPNCIWVDNT